MRARRGFGSASGQVDPTLNRDGATLRGPTRAWLNAVAATPEGVFVSARMMERLGAAEDEAAALHDEAAQGYVVTWSPQEGLGRLAGGDGAGQTASRFRGTAV